MGSQLVTIAVSGYFDPLHVGHLEMLEQAKSLGDYLVVIVNNDIHFSEAMWGDLPVGFGTTAFFPDNAAVYFGDSEDLKVYHDGSHSYIDDKGTGNLKLRSNNFRISNGSSSYLKNSPKAPVLNLDTLDLQSCAISTRDNNCVDICFT